eukprot:8347087-Pyramimonas_sp.AAC.1
MRRPCNVQGLALGTAKLLQHPWFDLARAHVNVVVVVVVVVKINIVVVGGVVVGGGRRSGTQYIMSRGAGT